MSLPLVLITGATGYLGSHIVLQALEAGYPVRITTRPAKVEAAKKQFGGTVDVAAIADIVDGDFTEALKGVGAVIHAAAPLAGRQDAHGMLDSAVKGALNVVRQSAAAGVTRVVVTSSWGTANDIDAARTFTDYHYTDKDWNPATREQVLDGKHHPLWVYSGAKTISEQEVWKFADEHPEVDITTINPPYLYGPLAPGTVVAKDGLAQYSTPGVFYTCVLQAPGAGGALAHPQFPSPLTIDVRDAARAHILALRAPAASAVGRKRLLMGGPSFTWKDAVEHLTTTRPALAREGRLKDPRAAKRTPIATIDVARMRAVLGFGEFTPWEKTVEDMTDSLLAVEKSWE
ncbi:NAD(P)-binding protein [Phellopilus nigrolimitatus]|nr:NAD(P)-binding protein [Phellopilus nigrolimitatus]